MILANWLALVALAIAGWSAGRLDVALLAAAGKTLLIGLQFMELHTAARAHQIAWTCWTLAATSLLLLLT